MGRVLDPPSVNKNRPSEELAVEGYHRGWLAQILSGPTEVAFAQGQKAG
jgi:hypothetical protein